MYRIGYIDDEPTQFSNFAKKLRRRYQNMELILFEDCKTKEEFVEKIYEEHVDVLLVDYKMAGSYGFQGTTLINYINDQIRDIECFILTAVDQEQIADGLVAKRNRYSKTIFDTEGDDEERVKELNEFVAVLRESADVFRVRREEKLSHYRELQQKKKAGKLEEYEQDDYLRLYKVLSSYGMVEKLPESMLKSDFEKTLEKLLKIGDKIIEKYD